MATGPLSTVLITYPFQSQLTRDLTNSPLIIDGIYMNFITCVFTIIHPLLIDKTSVIVEKSHNFPCALVHNNNILFLSFKYFFTKNIISL